MNIKVKTALRATLICVTVLPLIITALVATINIFGFAKNMVGDEASTLGAALGAGVDNIVCGYADDTAALSNMSAFKKAVSDLNSVKSELGQFAKSFTDGRDYVLDVVVTDKEGLVIFDTKGASTGSGFCAFEGDAWKSQSGAFVSSIKMGEATYGTDIFVTVSAMNDGYVAMVVDLKAVTDYLEKCVFLNSGSLVIVDKDTVLNYNGTAVAALSATNLSNSVNPDIQTILSTKVDDKTGTKLGNGTYIGAYGRVESSRWTWLALYPSSDATSTVTLVFIISLVIIIALALACALVMMVVTQSVINPMLDMLKTMKNINSGNHQERIDTSSMGREFAHIADSFNEMMDQALLSEELHKTVSDLSDNMLFEWDFAKETMFLSNNFKEKIALNVAGATLNNGKFIDSMMNEDDSEKYKRDINQLFKTKDDVGNEYLIKNAQGQDMWVSMRAHCITDRLGEILRVIGVLTDINSEKNATLKLTERASYDFLSQLYNRNTFEREFQQEIDRNINAKVAALFIDVDDFKFINDRYSHAVGDEVIKFVADVIKSKFGEKGFAGRYGGDEFVLCVSDPKMVENVEVLSMDIIDDLYSGYYSKSVDTTLNIKASIGIAIYPEHNTDARELVGCADAAMYFVKKNGKANYHIYDPSDSEAAEGNHSYSL